MAGGYLRYSGRLNITEINEERLSKNRLVKKHDLRDATLVDIKHHIIPILKKKLEVIILHVGTNGSVSRSEIRMIFLMICFSLKVPLLRPSETFANFFCN